MDNDPLGIGVGQTIAPSSTTTSESPDPLGLGIKKTDTSLPDSYREASKANPDHVSKAQDIAKRTGIDPNYALANINDVQAQADMPDFDALKSSHPATHKLVSDPKVMGKAWDDIGSLIDSEGHAKTGKQASTLLQAALAGFQGSGTGLAIRRGMPDVVLGDKPPFSHEVAAAGAGLVSDLPEMILGGILGGAAGGAATGPAAPAGAALGAGAGGFALPAAFRQALIEHYTHGNIESTQELLRRAWAIAVPTAKQAAVGLAMSATGGGAATLGAGAVLTKGAEVAAMTTASAALDRKFPTARDFALNAIMLTGAHVAGITWDRMGDAAKASKLRTRAPQTFSDHADNVSGPAYIPADKFDEHFGPDAEDMAKKLGITQAYNAAKATGGDIEIPAGKYLSKDMDAHRDAFKDDVKSDAEAQTVNQIKEAEQQRKAAAEQTDKTTGQSNVSKLSIIIHGETNIGAEGKNHGQLDPGINAEGKEQAASAQGEFSRVIASDTERAKQTAQGLGAEVGVEPGLNPIHVPEELSGRPVEEVRPALEKAYATWAKDPNAKALGNETFAEYQQRVLAGVKKALADVKPGENPALVLTSDTAQLLHEIAKNGGKPLEGDQVKAMLEKEKFTPGARSELAYDPATGTLSEPGGSSAQPSQGWQGLRDSSSAISVDPKIEDVKARADDWLEKEAKARGMVHDDNFKLQFGTYVHKGVNDLTAEMGREFKALKSNEEKSAWLESEAHKRYSDAAQSLYDKLASLREAYPEMVKQIPHDHEGEAKILEGFKDINPHHGMTPLEQREAATSEAVASANQETGLSGGPVPGLDQKTQDELDKMQEAARKEAENILMKPQLEELKARNRKLIDNERERARGEIEAQVGNEPVFRAYSLLNPAGAEREISQKTIWKKANEYINGKLGDDDNQAFEAIAEMSGFSSADEMARKLLITERGKAFESEVKNRLSAHMAQFADLKDTTALKSEALRAVHNEKSGELLALQYQIMEGMAQNEQVNAEQASARRAYASQRWEYAKQFARETIGEKAVETAGRFRAYYTAERNAAVRAEKAAAEGNWQEAGKAKLEQLQAHAMAAESLRVRDAIDRWQTSIEKQQKSPRESWKDQDHFFQAADIMRRFGFEREDYNQEQRAESLSQWADRMSEKIGDDAVNVPDWIKDESVVKNWRKLTPGQLEDVRNTLKNIKHVGSFEDELQSLARGQLKSDFVGDLVEEAQKNVRGGHTPGADPRADLGEKMWNATERWGNVTYAVETMLSKLDGWKLGGKWGQIIRAKAEAQDKEAARKSADAAWWNEANSAYTPKELIERDSKKIYIPEIGDSLSKNAMIVAIANTGTESNLRVLKEGRGWTDGQIEAIKRHMDARDFDVMQAILDRHEQNNKPALSEMAKRRTGFEPKWIEAKTIQTPFGDKRGGYLPLIRDNRVSSRAMEDASLDEPPQTFKAATYQGFTKERNRFAQYPVSLDINDQLRAFNRVSHYLTMQDWVSDMNSLMNDKEIKSTIIDTSGKDRLNTINNWVKDVAGNGQRVTGSLDAPIRTLTDHTVISQLGTKLSVTLATGTHGIFAVGGVDPENFGPVKVYGGLLNFMWEMTKDPLHHFSDSKAFMLENSKYMAQHAKESEASIEEAADRMAGNNRFKGAVRDFAFSAMHGLYNLTITPIWNDAYKTGLILKDGSHEAAVDYANMIVRNSSPPGRTSDIPTIMHDSAIGKLLFLMHGFADRQYQMMVRAGGRFGVQVRQAGSPSDVAKATAQFLGTYTNVLVLPGIAMAGLKMVGSNDSEREKKVLEKHVVRALSPLTTYPVISAMQDMAIDASFGVRGNTSLSPVGSIFDSYQRFVNETASRKSANEQKAEGAAKLLSFAVPYPQTVNDAAFNLADIIFNGMSARPSDLIRRRPARERGQ